MLRCRSTRQGPDEELQGIERVGLNHQKAFQVPKMEESSPIKAVCKAYVREKPPPKIAL